MIVHLERTREKFQMLPHCIQEWWGSQSICRKRRCLLAGNWRWEQGSLSETYQNILEEGQEKITLAMPPWKLKRWPGKHVQDEDKDSEDKNTVNTTLKERLQGRRRKYFQRRRPSQVRRGGESEQGCPWIFFLFFAMVLFFFFLFPNYFTFFCIRCFLCFFFTLFLSKSFRGAQIGIW